MRKEINLHPKQYEAFDFKTQYAACICGVQSGKTFLGSHWAFQKLLMGDGLIAAPTYKVLQQSTLKKFFEEYPILRPFYKEQKGEIFIPAGTIAGIEENRSVFIRSMDNPLGVEGMTIKWAWLDEAGQMPLLAWTITRSRLSIARGQCLITTTPYNMGWLYQDFYKPWKENKDSDLSVFTWRSIDNPYFPKDFYEKEKMRLKPAEFAKRYEGEFSRLEGLVYNLHNWHIVPRKEIRKEYVLGGVDWGYTNPAALSVIVVSDGAYYIVDEWYEVGKTTPEIKAEMIRLQNKWRVNRWYADSANPEKVQEVSTGSGLYVVPFEKKKDSISEGISTLNQYLNENKLFVFDDLKNTLAEFETYQYPSQKDGVNQKEDPLPFNNHLMDAIRYPVTGYQPAKRFEIPKISLKQYGINRLLNEKHGEDDRPNSYQ